jgi:hypothetical protein
VFIDFPLVVAQSHLVLSQAIDFSGVLVAVVFEVCSIDGSCFGVLFFLEELGGCGQLALIEDVIDGF